MVALAKGYKLNNVSHGALISNCYAFHVAVQHLRPVSENSNDKASQEKYLHLAEVCIAQADDDDRHGEMRGCDEGFHGAVHVQYGAILRALQCDSVKHAPSCAGIP